MWAKIDRSASATAIRAARWRSSNGSSRTRAWVRIAATRFMASLLPGARGLSVPRTHSPSAGDLDGDLRSRASPDVTGGPRRATVAFILVTVTLDMLAFGIVIPVLPRLVLDFTGGSATGAAWWQGV